MKKEDVKKNKSLKKVPKYKTKLDIRGKMIINVILIVILLVGSIFMFFIASSINVESRQLVLSYEEKSDVSYTVTLKDNDYYPSKTLDMNQQYPSSLIDKIKIKYKYNYHSSVKGDYKYRYFTTANLVITNRNAPIGNNNLLLSRNYQLQNQITGKEVVSDTFDFEKEYTIDYNTYNSFVNKYRNSLGLIVDSYLKVSTYVEVIDEYGEHVVNLAKTMDVNIPLASNPISITVNNPDDKASSIYEQTNSITFSTFFVIFALIMLIAGVLLFAQEIIKVIKSEKEQSKFINKLNKIISTNSDVIVRVKNKINLKNRNIIEVSSMNELLDAQNELRLPIAYFETKSNKEGYFVIVNGQEVWRYILTIEEDK